MKFGYCLIGVKGGRCLSVCSLLFKVLRVWFLSGLCVIVVRCGYVVAARAHHGAHRIYGGLRRLLNMSFFGGTHVSAFFRLVLTASGGVGSFCSGRVGVSGRGSAFACFCLRLVWFARSFFVVFGGDGCGR